MMHAALDIYMYISIYMCRHMYIYFQPLHKIPVARQLGELHPDCLRMQRCVKKGSCPSNVSVNLNAIYKLRVNGFLHVFLVAVPAGVCQVAW